MSYGTIYTAPFQSGKGIDYIVEIQKENYTGRSIELKGSGDTPFSVELVDEDFLYTPSRFSTATIRVVGNDYLQSLYSTGYQQYRVNFKQGARIVWTGFVTPELYTQDYTSTLFDLEIQCVSAMSTLEYIKYKEIGENRAFVSLWDLLKKCITDSRGLYSSVYIPHVYAASAAEYNTTANVLQSMTVSEQDFFDEDDEPMTLKEVLEEVCKLLNWTCADWRGELFFVDVDHKGSYRKYSVDLSSFETVSTNTVKVQDVGFAGSDHALDILGGYNKAIVRVSNYCVGRNFTEENFDDLKVFKDTHLFDDDKVCRRLILTPDKWSFLQYSYSNGKLIPVKEQAFEEDGLFGAVPMKYCCYGFKKEDGYTVPTITDYSYTQAIQIRQKSENMEKSVFTGNEPILIIKGPTAAYSHGAFAISGARKAIVFGNAMSPIQNAPLSIHDEFVFSLRIGKQYYNGAQWVFDSSARFSIPYEGKEGMNKDYEAFKNTKTLSLPYNGLSGYIIPIKKEIIGDVELIMYGTVHIGFSHESGIDYPIGCFLKDFKVTYQKEDTVFDDLDNKTDRYYENIVNEGYVNPLDEIEFKISSYNNDGACYSKVMLGDNYLTDNLYSVIENNPVRPEEHLIRRIVNQYSATKNKLTQVLMYSDLITPISTVTDKYQPDKRFTVTGGVIDFAADSFNCVIIQNGN